MTEQRNDGRRDDGMTGEFDGMVGVETTERRNDGCRFDGMTEQRNDG
eukprot:gene6471-16353_t